MKVSNIKLISVCDLTRYCVIYCVIITTIRIKQVTLVALENVAVGKTCNDSSKYTVNSESNDCSCAVNNNITTEYVVGDCNYGGNCIHTSLSDLFPAWTVDLGRPFSIQTITVYARELVTLDHPWRRMNNVKVAVDGLTVYTFPLDNTTAARTVIGPLNSRLPAQGRYVTLSRAAAYMPNGTLVDLKDWGAVLLNFCEVQVWVCKVGHYGNGGTCIPCRTECQNSICDDLVYPNTCPEFDPCNSNPCANGRSCEQIKGGNPHNFTCRCPTGYTGWNCSTDINECDPQPCLHGSCKDVVAGYICNCDSGYNGENCSIDINDCQSRPCVRGHCQDLVNGFLCHCDDGYEGETCNIVVKLQNDPGPIVGAFFGGAALMACVSFVGFCIWKRRMNLGEKKLYDQGKMTNAVLYSESPDDFGHKSSGGPTPDTLKTAEAKYTEADTVTVDNTYDKLQYGNDDNSEGSAYSGLRFTKQSKGGVV